jgi:vitamin B12 transporter
MSKTLTLLLTMLASNALFAQKDSASTRLLDEVVVTANKQEQKQSTTGKVITVIGKDLLAKSSGRTLGQVLNESVGLTINGALNNAGTNQTVFMRGANSGRTLVLLDGIPVNDPSQINNEFDLNLFSINDIEKIEVCRGAQSTLYGSDAVAGVINIITIKNNVTKPYNLKATVSAGNLNTIRTNLQLFGKSNKLTYTVRHARLKTDGFSAAYDSTGIKNFDKDGYDGSSSSASIQYAISDRFTIKGFGMYNAYQSSIDAGVFSDDKYYQLKNNMLNTGGGFQYKSPKITITGNYQFSQTNRGFERDSLDKAVFSFYQRNNYFAKTQFVELYANLPISKNLSLLQGVEYRYASMNNQFFSVSSFGPFNSGFKDTSVTQSSIYSSLLYNNKKGFAVDLGFRLNKHSMYGNNQTITFNPSYQVDENTRLFGSIATAFKVPSLYQLFDPFSGRKDLQPEKSTNIEAGIANANKNFSSRLVLFYRTTNNGIDYDYVRNKYYNFIKQTAFGVEYETSASITKQLSVRANFSFLSMADSTQSRVSFKDTGYVYGLRRPGINANISLNYDIEKLSLSLSGKYVSSRNDIGGFKRADVALAAYFLLNAYGEFRFNTKVKIFVDTQNLTNQTFFDLRGFNSIPFMINSGISINL